MVLDNDWILQKLTVFLEKYFKNKSEACERALAMLVPPGLLLFLSFFLSFFFLSLHDKNPWFFFFLSFFLYFFST